MLRRYSNVFPTARPHLRADSFAGPACQAQIQTSRTTLVCSVAVVDRRGTNSSRVLLSRVLYPRASSGRAETSRLQSLFPLLHPFVVHSARGEKDGIAGPCHRAHSWMRRWGTPHFLLPPQYLQGQKGVFTGNVVAGMCS